MSSPTSSAQARDPFARGQKGINTTGSLVLTIGRLIEVVFQLLVLLTPLLSPILSALSFKDHLPPLTQSTSPLSLLDLSLSSIPTPRLLLIIFNIAVATKQIYWAWAISLEPVSVRFGVELFFINAVSSALFDGIYLARGTTLRGDEGEVLVPSVVLGFAIAALGLVIEAISEIQRRRFKNDRANKGKLFTGGLFRYARHVNYTGFALSRAGLALMTAGWVVAAIVLGLFTMDLGGRAASILDEYCGKRYGAQWTQYKKTVSYKMYPGIL